MDKDKVTMIEGELTPFSEDIKKDEKVIARVNGWFTKEGAICLQGLITFSPKISDIKIITDGGCRWEWTMEGSFLFSDGRYLQVFELPLMCARGFEIEIEMSDNEKLTFKLDKREEVLKEVIEQAIKNVAGKKPVVIIEREKKK